MRSFVLFAALVMVSFTGFGQKRPTTTKPKTDTVKPVQPAPVKQNVITKPDMRHKLNVLTQYDLRERLVQLAIQNPQLEIADHSIDNAVFGVKKAKAGWLNTIAVQGNLNEFSITNQNVGVFYPKYNFGVSIPLGLFGTVGNDVKIAKTNVDIAVAQKNDIYRDIKALILSKYEDYLMRIQLYDLQVQLASDEYTNYKTAQEKYKLNEIAEDDYNKTYKNYNNELARQITLERDVKIAVIEIEKLIGTDLASVIREFQDKLRK